MTTQSPKTILLATDQQRSVLNALDENRPNPFAYTPYGHRNRESGFLSLLGFNGEPPDPMTGHYHLGKGYRQFNPVLMRFNSPDSWSPFGKGGLNMYAYCGGDPLSRVDPNGHAFSITKMLQKINITKTSKKPLETRVPKELEKYIIEDSPFFKQRLNQMEDDFIKGEPSATKIKELEENFWQFELKNNKKIADKYEIIADEKERFYNAYPMRLTIAGSEPVNFNRQEFLINSRKNHQTAAKTSTIRKT